MAIHYKSKSELALMRASGEILASVLLRLQEAARPGVSTFELDALAQKLIKKAGQVLLFLVMVSRLFRGVSVLHLTKLLSTAFLVSPAYYKKEIFSPLIVAFAIEAGKLMRPALFVSVWLSLR